jgi:hypothetical protein
LPTDVVVSSVKTILLKMCWIVLIRSAIFLLAYMLLSSYLCEFCVLSLIYFFESRFPRGWTISCLILIGSIFGRISGERHRHQHEQSFLVGGVEKKPLVSGVVTFNMAQEDPIVYPTLPPPP